MSEPNAAVEDVEAFAAKQDGRVAWRAWWELRHARCRLALAENDLAWAQTALTDGQINASAALEILDATMDDLAGPKA